MKSFLIAASIGLMALSSCQKVAMPANTSQLFGSWKVVTEPNGWGANSKTKDLVIYKFTKQGRCYIFTNTVLTRVRDFKFTRRRSIYSTEQEYLIDYDKGTDQSFKIEGNTLYLNEEAFDAGGYELTKK
jgi:hypothetical protein